MFWKMDPDPDPKHCSAVSNTNTNSLLKQKRGIAHRIEGFLVHTVRYCVVIVHVHVPHVGIQDSKYIVTFEIRKSAEMPIEEEVYLFDFN